MFNVEKYIESCLNSIFSQTFRDFEVILIDDYSTDRSAEIVQEKFGQEPRLKLVRHVENLGEGAARNLGLTLARGKYVYFMDSDDAITPKALETLYNAAEESGADVVYMNARFRPDDPEFEVPGVIKIKIDPISNLKPGSIPDNLGERLNLMFAKTVIPAQPWFKLQRRDLLIQNQITFSTVTRSSDLLFTFAELCFAKKIQVIDFCGYIHRPTPTSVMHSSAEKSLRQAILSLPIAVEYVEKILGSKNLIQPINRAIKDWVQTKSINLYFFTFISQAYRDKIPAERIFEIIGELVYNPKLFSPNFMRAMIISTARNLFRIS